MAYTKTNWVNGETALSDINMNHIENGIAEAHEGIEALHSSAFGTTVTIPRTLIPNSHGNNDTATFDYTFPSDGYLIIRNETELGSLPINAEWYDMKLNGVNFTKLLKYNDSTGGSGSVPTYYQVPDEFVYVKKGMILTGTIHLSNLPNALSNIKTLFVPFEESE